MSSKAKSKDIKIHETGVWGALKKFRRVHLTVKKLGFSFGMASIIATGYLNIVLVQDYQSPNQRSTAQAQNPPILSDDTVNGKITAENQSLKVVWHYKTLPAEYNNRSGGNIYEMYDKRSDPQGSFNLVGVNNYGGGGTHNALTGMGGLGVTGLYDNLSRPLTGDNGLYASLISKNSYLDGSAVIVNFEYSVKSNTVKDGSGALLNDYSLIKEWRMSEDVVTLRTKATMLRDARISEPRISFNFKRDYWDKAEIYGHDMLWPNQNCQGPNTNGFSNPQNGTTSWNLNDSSQNDKCYSTRHAEKLTLSGNKSSVALKIDNSSKGFESGGMFNYGYSLWGTKDNNMSTEFVLGICGRQQTNGVWNIDPAIVGAVDLHWFPWWGGDPPEDSRYKEAKGGDVFIDDTFRIEVTAPAVTPPANTPTTTPSGTVTNSSGSQTTTTLAGTSEGNPSTTTVESPKGILEDPAAVLGEVAKNVTEAVTNPQKSFKNMTFNQKLVVLIILLAILFIETLVINRFTHFMRLIKKYFVHVWRKIRE